MKPFVREAGPALLLPLANVDTDQLMPARFMKEPRNPLGYGRFLLSDFALETPALKPVGGQRIMVARRNFGCGSSREAAVYALADFGFACVIAPSFGDIFASNAVKNGVLPAIVSENDAEVLLTGRTDALTVDLDAMTIKAGDTTIPFAIDPIWRRQLLNGWDDIDLTMAESASIAAFVERDRAGRPWAGVCQERLGPERRGTE